jgi:CHAD domain-containing protein
MKTPTAHLLLDALDKRWNHYHTEVMSCRQEASREVIHDLRVAIRRLLSVIEVLRVVEAQPDLEKLRKYFKEQSESLDKLRDTQVMMAEVSEALEELPEAKTFLKYLSKREKRWLHIVEKKICSTKPGNLIKRISLIRKSLIKHEADESLHQNVLRIADNAFARVLQCFDQLDRTEATTIHRLRIAFRRFRYLIEIIHPLLYHYPSGHLSLMHDFQAVMGDIQDIEILLDTLSDYSKKEKSFNGEPVRRYYRRRYIEALAAFDRSVPQIGTFWRSSPRASFPWNANRHKSLAGKIADTPPIVGEITLPAETGNGIVMHVAENGGIL